MAPIEIRVEGQGVEVTGVTPTLAPQGVGETQAGGQGLREVLHIYARKTFKTDAYTTLKVVKVFSGTVKVLRYNHSRSGAHWEEKLLASEDADAIVYHIDISNSGKHYCRILRVRGTNVEVIAVAERSCPIHHVW